jgi:hypothetical protein
MEWPAVSPQEPKQAGVGKAGALSKMPSKCMIKILFLVISRVKLRALHTLGKCSAAERSPKYTFQTAHAGRTYVHVQTRLRAPVLPLLIQPPASFLGKGWEQRGGVNTRNLFTRRVPANCERSILLIPLARCTIRNQRMSTAPRGCPARKGSS